MLLYRDWSILPAAAGRPSDSRPESLLDRLLDLRGLTDTAARAEFLAPEKAALHDPFLFQDMKKACQAIIQTMRDSGHIVIHGDYDVDGLTSTALVIRFLRYLQADCEWVIPDRLTDGYGLSDTSVSRIVASGADLVITVDCGIASLDEISRLRQAGIPVIVTDHHECRDVMPEAVAIINPKQPGCLYPFAGLAGVGVALKLLQALSRMVGQPDLWQKDLSLATLGTVADVVPLIDENRILVARGLKNFHQTAPVGLQVLADLCQQQGKPMQASTLGFTFAPRLNAAGRMGDLEPAITLLLTDDIAEAQLCAEKLQLQNHQRQDLEAAILAEAIEEIDRTFDPAIRHPIILAHQGWHPGVLGIVSSRLVDLYCRPVIVLTGEADVWRGSCRTYGDFDLLAAITAAADFTRSFGGHRKAAGLELDYDQLAAFRTAINLWSEQHMAEGTARPVIQADMEIPASDLTAENAAALQLLEPYGEENRQPLFIVRDFRLIDWKLVGSGRHVRLRVQTADGSIFEGMAFGFSEADELFKPEDQVDLLFALEWQVWRGKGSIRLMIRDIHPSSSGQTFFDQPWIAESLYQASSPVSELADRFSLPTQIFLPEKREFKAVYQYLKSRFAEKPFITDLSVLAGRIGNSYQLQLNAFRLSRILAVFQESNLVSVQAMGHDRYRLMLLPSPDKRRLEDAPSWQRLQGEGGFCHDV